MNMNRDLIYENEILQMRDQIFTQLDKKNKKAHFELDDYYAIERMIQILVESLIGLGRYVLKIKYQMVLSKSGEVFNELFKRAAISEDDLALVKKMIGYRNTVVHDYLNVNPVITSELVRSGSYRAIQQIQNELIQRLNDK